MIPLIEQYRQTLDEICRRYRVRKLELFGSAADGTFDAEKSDLDFLVEFVSDPSRNRWDDYWDLRSSLEKLFNRKVDLVEPGAMRNPYFIRRVNESRREIYAA